MIPAAEDAAAVPKAALTDTDYMKHISREKSKTFRKETFSERRAFLLFLRNAVKRDDDHIAGGGFTAFCTYKITALASL